jgi:hypothetical protein
MERKPGVNFLTFVPDARSLPHLSAKTSDSAVIHRGHNESCHSSISFLLLQTAVSFVHFLVSLLLLSAVRPLVNARLL